MTYELSFEVEPVSWARPRACGKRFFTAPKMRVAMDELRYLMKTQFKRNPLTGPLRVELVFSITPPKKLPKARIHPAVKPDLSNLVKLVEDAGNEILWADDNLIVEISARKEYGTPGIRMQVQEIA